LLNTSLKKDTELEESIKIHQLLQ